MLIISGGQLLDQWMGGTNAYKTAKIINSIHTPFEMFCDKYRDYRSCMDLINHVHVSLWKNILLLYYYYTIFNTRISVNLWSTFM